MQLPVLKLEHLKSLCDAEFELSSMSQLFATHLNKEPIIYYQLTEKLNGRTPTNRVEPSYNSSQPQLNTYHNVLPLLLLMLLSGD